jgi:anaerobic selenocysteine-containing dehydrogenase
MDPLPAWRPPFEDETEGAEAFPLHAVTQRPMPIYHSWGSQNAWLRQILDRNALIMNAGRAAEMDLKDGDWVRVVSRNGAIVVRLRVMDGVQRDTVWTWNGIGKRLGAWTLDAGAPEATQGFLLNHLIAERLPADQSGKEPLNADPVTGQAAWFDLRVRVEKLPAPAGRTAPQFAPVLRPPGIGPAPRVNRFGGRKR